jgi:hypothetical protein
MHLEKVTRSEFCHSKQGGGMQFSCRSSHLTAGTDACPRNASAIGRSRHEFSPLRTTLGRFLQHEFKVGDPGSASGFGLAVDVTRQRKCDWQPQPIFWQFEASVKANCRAIIATNERTMKCFAGFRIGAAAGRAICEVALRQMIGR